MDLFVVVRAVGGLVESNSLCIQPPIMLSPLIVQEI